MKRRKIEDLINREAVALSTEESEFLKTSARKGIETQQDNLAEALGISRDAMHRFAGTEIEFTSVANEETFKRRAAELAEGGNIFDKYAKSDGYMPEIARAPYYNEKLHEAIDKLTIRDESTIDPQTGQPLVIHGPQATIKYTSEPTGIENLFSRTHTVMGEDDTIDRDTRGYGVFQHEVVVERPQKPIVAASWIQGMMNFLINKAEDFGLKYIDLRSKTPNTFTNSIHQHESLFIDLPDFVNSKVFTTEQKLGAINTKSELLGEELTQQLLEKVRIQKEDVHLEAHDIQLLAEKEQELGQKNKADTLKINMFSRRELEGPEARVTQEDVGKQYNVFDQTEEKFVRRKITKDDVGVSTRQVLPREVSEFGVMVGKKLEEFIQHASLIFSPTEQSNRRFDTSTNDPAAPIFNGVMPRKTMGAMGAYMFRGDGRISYGTYNNEGEPDKGPLRIEIRGICPEAAGHANRLYPSQRSQAFELQEGIEGIFAEAGKEYAALLSQRKENPDPSRVSEEAMYATYEKVKRATKDQALLYLELDESEKILRQRDTRVKMFMKKGEIAERIYGKERLKGMVQSRAELDLIHMQDFNSRIPAESHGHHVVKNIPKSGIVTDMPKAIEADVDIHPPMER